MSEGILNLNVDDDTQQDDNLFLSAPEQRGLEAATFGSVIGQAPATGSIFGDIFSTLAQTAPAAVATFKERQSIKEKEAEYKEKSKSKDSLAMKYVALATAPEDGFYELNSVIAQNPNLYVQGPTTSTKRVKVYRTLPNGKKVFDDVSISEYDDDKDETGVNKTLELIADRTPYFIWKGDESTAVSKPLTQEELQSLSEKGFSVSIEEPQGSINFKQREKQRTDDASTNLSNAISEYKAAGGVVRLRNEIMEILAGDEFGRSEALPGGVGGIALSLKSLSGAIKSGFNAAYNKESAKDRDLYDEVSQTLEREGANAPEDSIYGLVNKQLRKAQQEYKKTGDLSSVQKAQALKTLVTQLVYKVAKSRESGGKFSVPDIQFAFQSVGDSSSAEILMTGLDFLVRDVVLDNVRKLRSSGKAAYENEYMKADGLGRDNDLLDLHIFSGQRGFTGLDEYQDVMKEFYKYNDIDIPETWKDYDYDFQLNLKKAIEKKRKEKESKDEIEEILKNAIPENNPNPPPGE